MNGTIELHGSRLMVKADGQEIATPIYTMTFIPYDRVVKHGAEWVLAQRREQAAIGIVSKVIPGGVEVYLAHIGPACPSRLVVSSPSALPIGYRLLLWLSADGSITIKAGYSADPANDSRCLLEMYRLVQPRPELAMTAGQHHYTFDGVQDETELDTFTIDPATSKDFDDALTVDVENRTVYVHIVDMANAEINEHEAQRLRERCLTLYLANEHTEHLLDAETAGDKLSLIVGAPRNTVTVKVVLTAEGLVESYAIYRSVINVKNRYNYDEVQGMLDAGTAPASIRWLAELSAKRSAQVKYNINLPSIQFTVDAETGLTTTLETHSTMTASHQLVATAMILANMIVSKHLHEKGVVLPNRFHESLRGFNTTAFASTGDDVVDSFVLVKRFARAFYATDKSGHFGLGTEHYVHFTSPMRRYADVIVHKLLAGYTTTGLEDEVEYINKRSYTCRVIQDLYTHWKTINWLKRLPAVPKTVVTGVSKAGLQWYIPELSLNGFTHISNLAPKQFWVYNEASQMLTGSTTGQTVGVGLPMKATLLSVDPVQQIPLLQLSF